MSLAKHGLELLHPFVRASCQSVLSPEKVVKSRWLGMLEPGSEFPAGGLEHVPQNFCIDLFTNMRARLSLQQCDRHNYCKGSLTPTTRGKQTHRVTFARRCSGEEKLNGMA